MTSRADSFHCLRGFFKCLFIYMHARDLQRCSHPSYAPFNKGAFASPRCQAYFPKICCSTSRLRFSPSRKDNMGVRFLMVIVQPPSTAVFISLLYLVCTYIEYLPFRNAKGQHGPVDKFSKERCVCNRTEEKASEVGRVQLKLPIQNLKSTSDMSIAAIVRASIRSVFVLRRPRLFR